MLSLSCFVSLHCPGVHHGTPCLMSTPFLLAISIYRILALFWKAWLSPLFSLLRQEMLTGLDLEASDLQGAHHVFLLLPGYRERERDRWRKHCKPFPFPDKSSACLSKGGASRCQGRRHPKRAQAYESHRTAFPTPSAVRV